MLRVGTNSCDRLIKVRPVWHVLGGDFRRAGGAGHTLFFPRILAAWLTLPGGLNIIFLALNVVQRPQHRFLAKLWHKNDVFKEKKGVWGS